MKMSAEEIDSRKSLYGSLSAASAVLMKLGDNRTKEETRLWFAINGWLRDWDVKDELKDYSKPWTRTKP